VRTWKAIESCFQVAERRQLNTHPGTKWTVLRRLRGKALSIREMHNSRKVEENNGNWASEEVGMVFPVDENGDALGETWNWASTSLAPHSTYLESTFLHGTILLYLVIDRQIYQIYPP